MSYMCTCKMFYTSKSISSSTT